MACCITASVVGSKASWRNIDLLQPVVHRAAGPDSSTILLCRCRFGFAPIMSEWSACEPDHVLINHNLGVAFLRRISSDKAILETVASAEPGWQYDSVCRIWTLLCESLKMLSVYAL